MERNFIPALQPTLHFLAKSSSFGKRMYQKDGGGEIRFQHAGNISLTQLAFQAFRSCAFSSFITLNKEILRNFTFISEFAP